jgi:hypothetical protein
MGRRLCFANRPSNELHWDFGALMSTWQHSPGVEWNLLATGGNGRRFPSLVLLDGQRWRERSE